MPYFREEDTKRKQADAKASQAEIGQRDAERMANEAQLQKERERVRADEAEFNVNYWKEQAAKSASNSTLVVAAAKESTNIVTNLSLFEPRTCKTISSILSNISSTVSRCKYNIFVTSTPITSKKS